MRIVIIGGSGHVGTYLVPSLVEAGHEVVNITRGKRQPYQQHAAWKSVEQLVMDRAQLEASGAFGRGVADLRPDIVIDMICFTLASATQLVEALRGRVQHLLSTGTVWVHGPSVQVPTTEEQPRRPFGEYGIQKAAIEAYLLDQARRYGFPATVIHPGHIVGPGWAPLNPQGHFNTRVFEQLARGEELTLPNFGLETVHHVHAEDVAQLFLRSMAHWSTAVGQSFHAVSPGALSLRGYAESVYRWFGREPALRFLPWESWKETIEPELAAATWDHIAHSPNCSIAKAGRLVGYQPRYTSLQAVYEAVTWLIEHGVVNAPKLR
jgi:nucleoside-diphosphate-sugar epimerase